MEVRAHVTIHSKYAYLTAEEKEYKFKTVSQFKQLGVKIISKNQKQWKINKSVLKASSGVTTKYTEDKNLLRTDKI